MPPTSNGHATLGTTAGLELPSLSFADTGFRAIGDSGIPRFGGIIHDEPVHRLTGVLWMRTVRDMMTTSPVIKGMLFAVEMLIRRAEWIMEPAADGGTAAKEIADFVESCRLDMRTPWEDTLSQIVSFLPYGYSLHEVVYKRRLGTDGEPSSTSDDGRIGWDEWAPRSQDTLVKWVFDPSGHATAFQQQTPSQVSYVEIPLNKCLHFRSGSYKGSPEGESVLRSAVTDWDAINKLQIIEAIGIERDLAGLPVALVPPNILRRDGRTAADTATYNAVRKIVTQVRQNDQAGVVFPLDYDQSGKLLYDFKLLSAGGQRQFDTGAVINRRASHMTMAMLADFLMVGHSSTGSFALSQDKTRLFTTAISAWLDSINNVINDQGIRRLVAINGIDPKLTPKLRPGPLDSPDMGALGSFFTALWPLIQTFNRKDVLNIGDYLMDAVDFPTPEESFKALEAALLHPDTELNPVTGNPQLKPEAQPVVPGVPSAGPPVPPGAKTTPANITLAPVAK